MDSSIAGGQSEAAAAGVDVDLNCPGRSKEGEPGGHETSAQANQVYRLALRELGGAVGRYHRPPPVKKTTYEIAKPTVIFERIQMIKKLRGHHEVVNCSIFDRSAQLVITGSDDALVNIWSTRTGFCLGSCIGQDAPITDLAVSSKNNFVASASSDHSIRVWRLPDGFPFSVLGGHGGAVTAIEFSPRQGCEHHLLSSSEDGMCRIWDARYSAVKPHVYQPAPRDIQPVPTRRPRKASLQVSNIISQPAMRILCCAFNADGTIFVAGSSDNKAMVWSATECNFAPALTQRPTYELDNLVGHDKHVHCVRFSGCVASGRPFLADSPEKDYPASSKNTWSARDSIVTCSRDASTIIWIPLRRRHNSEADRWVKAYHLKVDPHPIPSELPRPRGRKQWSLRKRRGVNIIVWSLDSRFLLGAITDCRICVWNALDGSLAHSLTGHDQQTYVLDVHPFNPRIAMSAGYDGRAIIWDIWCGHPIRTYKTGEDSLVDGNFSPDGSSLVVSDNVGRIYLFATGDGSSLQNAKYEQFFRREQVDNSANVVGEESRNREAVLCDENLFPYDLQYQHFYREERLAAIKWKTPTVPHQIGILDPHDAAGPLGSPGPFQPTVAPSPEIEERDVSDGYSTVSVSDSDYSPSELELDGEEEEEKDDADTTKIVVILDGGLRSEAVEADDEDRGHSANIPKPCRNKGKAEAQAVVTSSSSRTRKRYNDGNILPKNMYEAKRCISNLGLNYDSIHAYPDGHVLFRKEYKESLTCPKCGKHKYRNSGKSMVPAKVLRHFPLIPRLQRMFRSRAISEMMTWATDKKSDDGLQRHAADSRQWKLIDEMYPEFAAEPRNVRLGLSLDGVNPFGDKNNKFSCWPVTILNYNLPPWMTTKRFFVLMVLLIPGPDSAVSANIDVFLAPLVEELRKLWEEGVLTYDVLQRLGRLNPFILRAIVILTIADYPAHGMISGQTTKGYCACTICGRNVTSEYSRALQKVIYMGHRHFLKADHPYRERQALIAHFGNEIEQRGPPARVTKEEIRQWGALRDDYIKRGGREDGVSDPIKRYGVKRLSILDLELKYWREFEPSKHNIDVMHIEKNICESLLRFLCGEKDTGSVRLDLEQRGMKPHLWLRPHAHRADVLLKYQAPYVLTDTEWELFVQRLSSLKVPSNYGSAFKKHIMTRKLGSMKSHDYHMLMQQVLPLCLRGLLQKPVRTVIMRLSDVFRRICVKVWDETHFPQLTEDVAQVLCDLEIYFPPAFFDVMTHLLVHVVEEVHQFGPVSARWLYPLERYMKLLKGHVRTYYKPEASMAKGYIKDETLGFLTEYIAQYEHVKTRVWNSDEEEGVIGEVLEGAATTKNLTISMRDLAHDFVLHNTVVMEPWIQEYESLKAAHPTAGTTFPGFMEWIRVAIREHHETHPDMDADVYLLSNAPSLKVKTYKRMRAYGNHFRVKDGDSAYRVTNDCGLITVFEQQSHNHDRAWMEMGYVGELVDIWALDYGAVSSPVILMKGSWVRQDWLGNRATMKRDNDGFLLANFRGKLPEWSEPFVFPSQVEQAFFLDVEDSPGWRVVCHKQARQRRMEGSNLEFHLHSHSAFDRRRSDQVPVVHDSGDFIPVTRVDAFAEGGEFRDADANSVPVP